MVTLRLCVGKTWGWPGGNPLAALWQIVSGAGLRGDSEQQITSLRMTRALTAAGTGAALAVSGVALQALLRNPLAEPYVLGLSTGAGVGVMAQLLLSYMVGLALGANHIGAIIGASLSMGVVYLAGRRRGVIDPLGILLVGVVLGTMNGAFILLLNYIIGPGGMKEDLSRWMMGNLNEGIGSGTLLLTIVVTLVGVGLLLREAGAMDAAMFSDTEARSMGVNLSRLRGTLFVVASVLAAGAVVLSGPVSFVGLVCPHVARQLLGPGHRKLIVGSALLGASLVVGADVAAAALDFGQGLLPIGVFTAMIGGPVFLWVLRPRMGMGG
jgi:iron complex transport system permease protein